MSNNVHYVSEWLPKSNGLPPNGEPPHNGGMEARVIKLEDFAQDTRDRLTRIEVKMDGFVKTFATKEDLAKVEGSIRADMHKEFTSQTWRIIGSQAALVAVVYFVVKYVVT